MSSNSEKPLIICGLGNPGNEYEKTRHNVGFRVVDRLSESFKIPLTKTIRAAMFGKGEIDGRAILLVKPMTYMNRSGVAVKEILERNDASPQDVLVICDDVNLPLGQLRLKRKGSSGGQKGLQSIIDRLRSEEFARLRLGVDSPGGNVPLEDYVLSSFKKSEESIAAEMIETALEAVLYVVRDGIHEAMSRFNRKTNTESTSI